jgi:two-component system chemotaxis sensor kinase CheA
MRNHSGGLSDEEFAELQKIFYSQSCEILEELQDLVLRFEAQPGDARTLQEIQRHFHTLKGDSNTIGLTSLSALCHKVEDLLAALAGKDRHMDSHFANVLLRSVDAANKILGAGESGTDAGLFEDTLELIDSFLGPAGKYVPREDGTAGYNEYQMLMIEDALKRGNKIYEADIVFHPLCAEKSVAAFMLLQRLNGIGEIIGSDPDLTAENTEPAGKVRILFSAGVEIDDIREKLFIAGITGELKLDLVDIFGIKRPAPAGGDNAGREHPEQHPSHSRSEILRVEASKVDRIMDLVGELIIGRSILDQIGKDAEEQENSSDIQARLYSANSLLERTVSDLQKGVMKMRMVPVNHVFRKFPRIVREISVDKGKKVRLETFGRDTELDKGLVDALGEPLVHLIRNSIDHGIEEPSVRRLSGKPEEGTIVLRAYHEAAQIIIEVNDDGRGIDANKIKGKALGKGLFKPDELESLSYAEALNLIFISGLSTSETVTDISGRGIGMDAVKAAIENMKGTIEMESSPGKGTKFTISLPLTLAVMKALLIGVGERSYALPVSAVSEVRRVTLDDLLTVEGTDTLMLRDRVISIIRMNRLFGVREDDGMKKFALILGMGNRNTGILADRLIGQQEIVVKPVHSEYTGTGPVSGASILGDGKVVLILDAPALFRKAIENEKKRMVEA